MNELKPCPFCGSIPKICEHHLYNNVNGKKDYAYRYYGVKCSVCFAEIFQSYSTEEDAIKAWNRRK